MDIQITNINGNVVLKLNEGDQSATITLPPDMASQLGAQLIGCVDSIATPTTNSFEEVAMMVMTNPTIDTQRSDTGKVLIALKSKNMRPIVLQADPAWLQQLIDNLHDA